ncbi:MAG: glycosyltransferase family 1 protein [Candidatus Thermofonsia Clade 1 bacterium]|jgi:D-inositol-3-phosphate glycosyltransferase|uniref:Glycosyltransferase family 1 protein n=1 Tax=Candidatus Thermofonsia Clade 1 bacterium TaxID=2364210 RepID=A0A2M8PH83_9CHLR|nr:MAG: glycosyltransferase family 1 protein [Candidatus Thermofonsia Clade 1 bacterium]RMF51901.1 MAG: glycosyltransferase family 1 protein [Chloroflexota bacterium]
MLEIARIAMLSVHTCPLAALGGKKTGGMNVYVRELSREFGRRGIQVDVFTRSQGSCAVHINQMLGENARVIHLPAGSQTPLDPDQIYPHLAEFAQNVLQFAAAHDLHYDLIYSHYWLSGIVAHRLRAAWRVPVVQMFHTLGMMKDRIAQPPGASMLQPADLRSFNEADIMSWADLLIAATPAERAQMLWLYRAPRSRIVVVPPGVNTAHFHPIEPAVAKAALGMPLDQKMLLFVGRIEPLKGVDTILQALALLKAQRPELIRQLTLSIIGGDPSAAQGENTEMDRLKALRTALGLEEIVVFLGARDQAALREYYAAAEALIMPSDYESFGLVALEAMACGTPVIASAVGGLAFLVRDGVNGYHVPVRDPQALAEKICAVLSAPEQRAQLGANAAREAAEYAWPRIADRLLSVFSCLALPIFVSASLPNAFPQG